MFSPLPMYTYPVFTELANSTTFVETVYNFKKGVPSEFSDHYAHELQTILEHVENEAPSMDLKSALALLYLEQWVCAKCLPEFAMLPGDVRRHVAKADTVYEACQNFEQFEIPTTIDFEAIFWNWAKKAHCDVDVVDYPDFIAACYHAFQTQ